MFDMKKMLGAVLVMLLTGCTSLSFAERVAAAWVLDKVPVPERQINDSLTGDEQVDEGEELSDTPTL